VSFQRFSQTLALSHANAMKRLFDLALAILALAVLWLLLLVVAILVKLTSAGPVIFWSDRVGKDNHIFRMPKFRTMRLGTPVVATNQLEEPGRFLTPIGSLLRRSSLDELPQLWSILKGDMSFVGPRPVIVDEHELLTLRSRYGVDALRPGLTGWAQINGRDHLSISEKVEFDVEYLKRQSLFFDCKILVLTVYKVFRRHGIVH